MAEVTYHLTKTINLGNYESIKIQCGITLASDPDTLEETFKRAKKFVDKKLKKETAEWVM